MIVQPKNKTMKKNTTANLEEHGWKPCKIDNKKSLTMLDAIEQVVMLAEGSGLCQQLYRSAKRPLQYICDKLRLTTEQALLFSIFINFSDDPQLELRDISRFFGLYADSDVAYVEGYRGANQAPNHRQAQKFLQC